MRRTIGASAVLAAGSMVCLGVPSALASGAMPIAQQNALVQKYCAVCHTDAARSGGLSLEHFDAADAAPSQTAMMLSKLTSGVSLETARAAASDPSAAALVAKKMTSGAMGAAGIPIPDKVTIEALISAFASESGGAHDWNVSLTRDPAAKEPTMTASILRELPSAKNSGEAAMYRLVLACNAATRQGEMLLSWAPAARTGTVSAVVDGKTTFAYQVEGAAAISLTPTMALPVQALTISNLFPNETVEFPFGDLPQTARQSLAACFGGSNTGQ